MKGYLLLPVVAPAAHVALGGHDAPVCGRNGHSCCTPHGKRGGLAAQHLGQAGRSRVAPTPNIAIRLACTRPTSTCRKLARRAGKCHLVGRARIVVAKLPVVLAVHPGDARATSERGYARLLSGDRSGAAEDFEQAAEATTDPKLLGLARDTRVRWALEEVGQPYEVRPVSFAAMKEPAHMALHPFGQIPTYEEGDLALFETGAIVFHIADRHVGLLPEQANAPARAITWMFAGLGTVEPPILELANAKILESDKPWTQERLSLVADRVRNRLKPLSNRLGHADWLDGGFSASDLMVFASRGRRDVVTRERVRGADRPW